MCSCSFRFWDGYLFIYRSIDLSIYLSICLYVPVKPEPSGFAPKRATKHRNKMKTRKSTENKRRQVNCELKADFRKLFLTQFWVQLVLPILDFAGLSSPHLTPHADDSRSTFELKSTLMSHYKKSGFQRSFWSHAKIHAQCDWTTAAPDNGNEWRKFRVVPRLHPFALPCFVLCLIGVEAEGLLDYQGGGRFPLYGGTFARSSSVSKKSFLCFEFLRG